MNPRTLTTAQRRVAGVVVAGAVVIAGIGFAGSYAAVRTLALHKGFGWFANVFPIGADAGIVVLLALDLLLTWLRIPFPLLRQTAWLLTAATVAFNAAVAWPNPLGVAMHAVIPVLFIVIAEAARHAVGRVADITADKHMEPVRLARWLLAPFSTFRLWRRMKLWELRSYEEVIRREQDRLTYRAHLRARYGPMWRRRAPVEALLPLRLARYGAALSAGASHGAARRLTVICTASLGPIVVPRRITPAPQREALPPAPASSPADEAPRRPVVICGASLGRITVPPRPVAAASEKAPHALPLAEPKDVAPVIRTGQPREAPQRPEPDAAAEFTRHADDALRLAGMSKAAAVRAVHEADPTAAAPQIVQRLAQHGITATASYVRTELSRQRKRRTATHGTGYYP